MEWYHVCWPWLTSKRVARFISTSWVSCCSYWQFGDKSRQTQGKFETLAVHICTSISVPFFYEKGRFGASCHSSESAIGRGKMSKGGWRRFEMEGQNHRGLGDGSPPAGCQGRSPGRNWRIFKVVTNKFYAFFGSISHIFTYICLCFFSFLQPPFH